MDDIVKRAREYVAQNAAESGADVLILDMAERIEILNAIITNVARLAAGTSLATGRAERLITTLMEKTK